MKIEKVKSGALAKLKGKVVKVISIMKEEQVVIVKDDSGYERVNVSELREISVEPTLRSILTDSSVRIRFERALDKSKQREEELQRQTRCIPKNHNKEYTVDEVSSLFTQFNDLVTSGGYITDLEKWIDTCSEVAEKMERTTVAISTQVSRIFFKWNYKPTPTIKATQEKLGINPIVPTKQTQRILHYLVHNK